MRQAGVLPANFDAERFADYLLTLGIKTRIDDSGEGRIVWIKDEQDLERGRTELATFMANPDDPRYKLAEDGARTIRKELEARDEQYRKNVVNVRRGWSLPMTKRAPLTMALLVTCIAVGLNIFMGTGKVSTQRYLGIAPASLPIPLSSPEILIQVRGGELWRLVTPILMHFDGFHLLFNMLMLQSMGTLIESREGTARFLGFVLLSALISNVAQYFVGDLFNLEFWSKGEFAHLMANPNFGGMSGVNYALFGYLWQRSRGGGAGFMLHPTTVVIMLGWMILCITGVMGYVANGAHVVGLLVGLAAGRMADRV